MNNPLVSIITVTYNAEKYIAQTMQSVFAQTYPNIEYIIIDGKSTDQTLKIIQGIAAPVPPKRDKLRNDGFTVVSEKDNGIYDAMNKGIAMAKGELIGIINASDFYEPDAVKTVVNQYNENSDAGVFHGNVNMLNADGSFFKLKKPNPNLDELYKSFSLQHPTFFVTKKTYNRVGVFDTSFRIAADYDFTMRCYRAGVKFCYIDKVITNFRQGGVSQNKMNNIAEGKRLLLKNGYDTETVEIVARAWTKKAQKEKYYNAAYRLVKKILPAQILNKLARNIKIK
ncbi:MAG: glycosyltransferase [Paludibacter sp.]|nr:glycosyltransferase [Paludibacter sp.]